MGLLRDFADHGAGLLLVRTGEAACATMPTQQPLTSTTGTRRILFSLINYATSSTSSSAPQQQV